MPLLWFLGPFYQTMRTVVRPATAVTRRKQLVVKQRMPREAFEDIFGMLAEGDAVGVKRDPLTQMLVPTSTTGGLNKFDFTIKRGVVTDKIFEGKLEAPEQPAEPKLKRPLEVAEIGEDEIYEVEAILSSRTKGKKGKRTEYLVKWLGWPDETNTWEPTSNLNLVVVLLRNHWRWGGWWWIWRWLRHLEEQR